MLGPAERSALGDLDPVTFLGLVLLVVGVKHAAML